MYKRNRASGNSGEKIACGKIMRVNYEEQILNLLLFLVSVLFDKTKFSILKLSPLLHL